MKRAVISIVLCSLVFTLNVTNSNAAVKSGAACKKIGQTSVSGGSKFTCTKYGKKLIWKKEIAGVTPTPVPDLANYQPIASDVQKCKLTQPTSNYFGTGFGFPRSAFRLKNTGEVKGLFLYVEFNDVKGTDDPTQDASTYVQKFIDFYKSVSYSQLNFNVEVFPKYLLIPKDSSSYGMDVWGKGNPYQYWKDGLLAAKSFVDFSKYEFVVVIPPSGIKSIIYGPSMPLPPGDTTGLTEQKTIYNGLMGGADQRNKQTRWIWLAHEIGHDLGMEHHFSYDGEAVWDLMNNVYDFTAPELLGWNRFFQGWMSGSSVACLESNEILDKPLTIRLMPLSSSGNGTRLILIKLTNQTSLAIEHRTITRFDTLDGDKKLEGVIAYTVDVSKQSNQNAFSMVTNSNPNRNLRKNLVGSLKSGDSVKSSGLVITIQSQNSDGYLVKISR